jgi:diguanylate cyclase (GGDEF)-like protein/PAS domain S-box-containing protein
VVALAGLRARPALAAALLVFVALMLLQPLPQGVGEGLAWGVQSVTVLVACAVLRRRARRVTGRLRQARLLVVAALLVGALAGVLAILWLVVTGAPAPTPSAVDAVHFLFVPLVVAGLLRYPVTDTKAGSGTRTLLDGAVAAGALWFVAYALLLQPARLGDGMSLATHLTTLAYPASDLFVLGVVAGVLPRVAPRARRELTITASGLALYSLADVAYVLQHAAGTYRADSWVSVLFEAGLLLILAGAFASDRSEQGFPRWARAVRLLPQLPMVGAIVLASWIALSGDGIDGAQLLAGIVLVGALFLRQMVSTRDRDVLTERLQTREELFRSLVTGASDLITLHDAQGRVTYVSPAVERVFGIPAGHLLGRSLGDVVEPSDRVRLRRAFSRVVRQPGAEVEALVRVRAADRELRWMQVLLKNQLHDPSVRGVVGNARDVHERHLLERQLSHAAFHDALTGLGNLAKARALLNSAYETGRPVTVVLVDLDGFKQVNDTFGHAHGDELLCHVAERLTRCLRQRDEVSRIGGDEFVLVLDGLQDAAAISSRVLDALRTAVPVAGTSLSVRASLGIALTRDAASPDELLRNADLAMYASKASGRDRVTWYEPWMHESARRRMSLQDGLRTALAEGQLALHYQPIVRLPDGAIVGAEALLRWDHPQEGLISPEVFIPVAEESGVIGEIDMWVLEQACLDLAAWRSRGLDVPPLSINVSRRHMTLDLPEIVGAALARHGLPGSALCIEVTESAVVPDAEVASLALTRVRELGVTVALDDFGSGQSSLSQLARLPVDSVKIDRSFTSTALSDPAALRLLTSIVGVCQALSLPIVAEGIEQGELADFLARIGCDRGQGFWFGRPQAARSFRALLPHVRVPASRTPHEAGEAVARPR